MIYDMAGQLTNIVHEKNRRVLAASHYTLNSLGRHTAQTRETGISES
jgi:hypothetical protein